MKVLVTGAGGQLATGLERTAPDEHDLLVLPIEELDGTDRAAFQDRIAFEQPVILINAAAYAAVDKAESEEELATRIDREGARNLSESVSISGARVLQ